MNGKPDEQPVHEVELTAYRMKKHEVTVSEYKAYLTQKMHETSDAFRAIVRGCGADASPQLVGKAKTREEAAGLLPKVDGKKICSAKVELIAPPSMPKLPGGFDGDDQPMINVTWSEAQDYCAFYGMSLPTEAQWERGARGLSGDKEYGTASGGLLKAEAHYDETTTASVCSKPENDFGLCDMAGNAWEWTADWYTKDAYQSMEAKDPTGPRFGHLKVARGGSWDRSDNGATHVLRATGRGGFLPDYPYNNFGFRCVAAPEPEE